MLSRTQLNMSNYGAPASYNVAVATSDIPTAWMPDARPRVASGGSHRILSIASQSGTVSSGQPIQFQLPAGMGAGFLVGGSAYIRMRVNVTQAPANTWAFKQTGAASSIVQRMSLYLSGTVAESIQQYNKLYSSLLQHACNLNYVSGDSRIAENTYSGSNTVAFIDVSIPIGLGLLNAKQHLPLFLLSSGMLQVDLASVSDALSTTNAANAITQFTVSNAVLVCEQLVPDTAYEIGMKQMLASRVYQLPFDTWYNVKYGGSNSIVANLGLNTSSLRSVLWNAIPDITTPFEKSFAPTSATQTMCQLTLDGALVANSVLDSVTNPQECYLEMNRALGNMFDITRTSIAPSAYDGTSTTASTMGPAVAASRALYLSGAYLGGLSCQRANDSGFSFVGTPVNQAVLSWTGTLTNSGEFYVYAALQQVCVVDANGTVNLIR